MRPRQDQYLDLDPLPPTAGIEDREGTEAPECWLALRSRKKTNKKVSRLIHFSTSCLKTDYQKLSLSVSHQVSFASVSRWRPQREANSKFSDSMPTPVVSNYPKRRAAGSVAAIPPIV